MRKHCYIESLLRLCLEHAGSNSGELLAYLLLEMEPSLRMVLLEATVHRSCRSKIFVATFTGPKGGQVWRTTGSTDYKEAMKLARAWEAQARAERVKRGLLRHRYPGTRVRASRDRIRPGRPQEEVAKVLRLSVRTVREIERCALAKLRQHPLIKQLFKDYQGGGLEEHNAAALDSEEIAALFDLAATADELKAVELVVAYIQL